VLPRSRRKPPGDLRGHLAVERSHCKARRPQRRSFPDVTNLPNSNLVSLVTDALNRNTDLTYDSLGNVLTVTRYLSEAPVTTTYTYQPRFNRVATIQEPPTHTTPFTYEASGAQNLQSISDPLGHQTSFTYDPQGQPQTIATPAGTTQLGYTLGDLTTITDP